MKPARVILTLLCATVLPATLPAAHATQLARETILSDLPVDVEGERNVFAQPFAYRNGMVFTVHVEPPATPRTGKEDMNLRTVVRKGQRQEDGSWRWEEKLIEPRTLRDMWHTQASIALDRNGYVHVAYNMHNMPWQYAVSRRPYDIGEFEFRGQAVSDEELATVKFRNKTPFPDIGNAAIPGNQVTYPMFFTDRDGELYLTYRYSLKPARAWERRGFSGGIARYDVERRVWEQIGGPVVIGRDDAALPRDAKTATQRPFAYDDGHTVYLITLAFDRDNGMHAFWNWRPEGAGMDTIKPSYAYSRDGRNFQRSDGSAYTLPISFKAAEPIAGSADTRGYYAPKSVAVLDDGTPMAIVQPLTGGREVHTYDKQRQHFVSEPAPAAAAEIAVDRQGRQWAFATGLRVFMREQPGTTWTEVGQLGSNQCYPRVRYYAAESRFVVHTTSCDGRHASMFTFRR